VILQESKIYNFFNLKEIWSTI